MANTGPFTITIMQYNVMKWTYHRRNELTNLYLQHDLARSGYNTAEFNRTERQRKNNNSEL